MCEAKVSKGASLTAGAANLYPPASAFRVSPFAMNFIVISTAVSNAEPGAAILVACAVLCILLARTVATRGR